MFAKNVKFSKFTFGRIKFKIGYSIFQKQNNIKALLNIIQTFDNNKN